MNNIQRKYCKSNSFQVTTDLLNSENLKIAIAQLCNELQVCNFTNSNLTFIALNLYSVVDSKAQQDNSNMQIQSPGTKTA